LRVVVACFRRFVGAFGFHARVRGRAERAQSLERSASYTGCARGPRPRANEPMSEPDDSGTELDALLVSCLDLPEEAWPSAIARARAERPDLAPALERRLEVLRSHGLLDADVEAPAREHIGDYRLLRRLGSGGMGIVYLAWSASRARTVALKLLRPSALA